MDQTDSGDWQQELDICDKYYTALHGLTVLQQR